MSTEESAEELMEENEHTGRTLHGSHWGTLEECMGEYVPIARSKGCEHRERLKCATNGATEENHHEQRTS